MRYIPPVPYEEEVWFYEELDENVYLIKMIPGIKPRILRSVFENYDCIIVESFGVGGIPQSIADDFYKLCFSGIVPGSTCGDVYTGCT